MAAQHVSENSAEKPKPIPKPTRNDTKHVSWSREHEHIFIEWCDKAMSYRWLHRECHRHYSRYNAMFTIPVIVLSTLTGTANFATEYFSDEARPYVPLVIGSVNIIAGIIGTVHQFLKVSEINEAHRVSYISWDKFYRNIKLELCKRPKERIRVHDMLRYSKEEYDRLIETAPPVSDHVIDDFKRTFRQSTFNFPEICDNLRDTADIVYQRHAHDDTNDTDDTDVSLEYVESESPNPLDLDNLIQTIKKERDTIQPQSEDLLKNDNDGEPDVIALHMARSNQPPMTLA